MESEEFDKRVDDEVSFFLYALMATALTGVGGILMYLMRWANRDPKRMRILGEIVFAFFLFPVYFVWKVSKVVSGKIAESKRLAIEAENQAIANQLAKEADELRLQLEAEEEERVTALPENRPKPERIDALITACHEEVEQYRKLIRDPEEFAIVEAQIRDKYAAEAERIFRRK